MGLIEMWRWWLVVKLLRFAVWMAPRGDAHLHLNKAILAWMKECLRQWELRYQSQSRG